MRMTRTLTATVAAAVLGLTTVSATAPAQADEAAAASQAKPKRTIVETQPNDTGFFKYRLKGKVTQLDPVTLTEVPYAKGKVKLMKKACKKCKFKQVGKFKTKKNGKFKVNIFRAKDPRVRWKWQVKVPGSDGFAATKGAVWTVGVERN